MINKSKRYQKIERLQEQQKALKKSLLGSKSATCEETPLMISAYYSVPSKRQKKIDSIKQAQKGMKKPKPKKLNKIDNWY
ncbi:MAG: hypothetical protein ACP5D2_05035 [Candidatus Nanoarchaeia archaeon]